MITRIDFIHNCRNGFSERRSVKISDLLCLLGVLLGCLAIQSLVANAGCGCSGGAMGNWDPSGFLNSELGSGEPAQISSTQKNIIAPASASAQESIDRAETFPNNDIIIPMKSVSTSDFVVDVSSADSYAMSHIKRAISLPAKNFLNVDGSLKTGEELAKILGEAGISEDDSVVIYCGSESTGDAELAYWVLRYLGKENVKLLDGNLEDWKAAGLPVESSENRIPAVEYKPNIQPGLLAEYEYVKSGQAQIVDARPFVEFSKGRIPGSTALDPNNIIKGNLIRNGNDLNTVFSKLAKDLPVVVYSNDYSQSSLVWYALQLMEYESSIYSWDDWKAHEFKDVNEGINPASGTEDSSEKYLKLSRI